MAWSTVSWAYKDLISSAKLAQMVENLRVHDHYSTDQGAKLPLQVANAAARTAIASPSTGMLVWQLDTAELYTYNGSAWRRVSSPNDTAESSYTPTWYDGAGAPPLFANGSRGGFWSRWGQMVVGTAYVQAASSGSFTPTADWSLELPVPMRQITVGPVGWYYSQNPALTGVIRPGATGPGQTRVYLIGSNGSTPAPNSITQVNFAYFAN